MARHPSGRRPALIATAGAAPVAPVAAAATACSITYDGAGTTYSDLTSAVAAAPADTTLLVRGVCDGPTTIGKPLTIKGTQKRRAATLSATGGGSTLTIDASVVRLMNLTVRAGSGTCSYICAGGGLFVATGAADLTNVTVIGSQVGDGGGVYISTGASVRLLGSTVVRAGLATKSTTSAGGAISVGYGTLTVAGRSRVIGSKASVSGGAIEGYAAAIYVRGRAQVTGNRTTYAGPGGGAIYAKLSSVEVSGRARIAGNRSWGGAGVRLDDGTTFTLAGNATITGNRADVAPASASELGGAGILAIGTSIIIRINDKATITGNRAALAGSGGGIRMSTGTTLEVDGTPVTCSSAAIRDHVFDNVGGTCIVS